MMKCKAVSILLISILVFTSLQVSADSGESKVTNVSIRLDTDGLFFVATGLYTYQHSNGAEENGSKYEWFKKDFNTKKMNKVENADGRQLRLSASDVGNIIQFSAIPSTDGTSFGINGMSDALIVPQNRALELLKDSAVFCVGSSWMLVNGERVKVDDSDRTRRIELENNIPMVPFKKLSGSFAQNSSDNTKNDYINAEDAAKQFGAKCYYQNDLIIISPSLNTELPVDIINNVKSAILFNEMYDLVEKEAKRLISHMDFTKPGLESLKKLSDSGNYIDFLEEFKYFLVDSIAKYDGRTGFAYLGSLGAGGTTADELMQGIYTIKDVNNGTKHTFLLGEPGYINWFPVCGAQSSLAVHMSTLSCFDQLIVRYKATGDIRYLERWSAIMSDAFQNGYPQWVSTMSSPMAKYFSSLDVAWGYSFFASVRSEAVLDQLVLACGYSKDKTKEGLSALHLSRIVNGMIEFNNPNLFPTVISNQEMQAIKNLIRNSLVLSVFKETETYIEAAKRKSEAYFGSLILKDGSDLEQAPSYNFYGVPEAVGQIMGMFNNDNPDWIDSSLLRSAIPRYRFLLGIQKPNKQYPNLQATGEGTGEAHFKTFKLYNNDPTSNRMIDNVIGGVAKQLPLFTSIYFPYGGYYAMRDGWDLNSNYMFMKVSRRGQGHFDDSFNHLALNAYGKNILNGAGGAMYGTSWENIFMSSSLSHNTISVDGYSQVAGSVAERKSAYKEPIESRWLTSENFDFGEGTYTYGYGNANGESGKRVLSDVIHKRQLVFIRKLGVYIVIDRMESQGKHTYNQMWNFAPDYSGTEITADPEERWIKSSSTVMPNLSIYGFSSQKLSYDVFYGQKEPVIRGWYKSDIKKPPVPAVECGVNFTSDNGGIIVSLIIPHKGINVNVKTKYDAGSDTEGFEAVLEDGTIIRLKTSIAERAKLNVGDFSIVGNMFLTVQKKSTDKVQGIILGGYNFAAPEGELKIQNPDCEFEYQNGLFNYTKKISIPTNFEWSQVDDTCVPIYQYK